MSAGYGNHEKTPSTSPEHTKKPADKDDLKGISTVPKDGSDKSEHNSGGTGVKPQGNEVDPGVG